MTLWASVTLGVLSLIVILATVTVCAVTISKIVSTALDSLSNATLAQRDALLEVTEQYDARLSGVLDRFQAIKWEDLAAIRSVGETDDGGFFGPEDDNDGEDGVTVSDARKFSPLAQLNDRLRLSAEEQELLSEDFPEAAS